MKQLELFDLENAPEGSRPLLENSVKAFGMIPNLHAVMAGSPQVLEAYQMLHKLFQDSSFNDDELTVIWQTINIEHSCHYCVPAHTAVAHMMEIDGALIDALVNKKPLPDAKLQALQDATLKIVRNRGQISSTDVDAFYAVGYEPRQLLEIVLGVSQKVMSNYINHIADTPVDEPFKKFA